MLRYTTDRARPDLVALYDIWPGNGAAQFLQPGARKRLNRSRVRLPATALPSSDPGQVVHTCPWRYRNLSNLIFNLILILSASVTLNFNPSTRK